MDDREAGLETLALQVASLADQLAERSRRVEELESETDLLLAKLAHQAAVYEHKLATLRQQNETETLDLLRRVKDLDSELQTMRKTWSWTVTRPLRVVQERRLRGHPKSSTD